MVIMRPIYKKRVVHVIALFVRNSDGDIWQVSKSDIDDFKTATADITTPPNRAPMDEVNKIWTPKKKISKYPNTPPRN
jgi:hypothetical protein